MRISTLDGQRVALWGWGREGKAAYRALRGLVPAAAAGEASVAGNDATRASDGAVDVAVTLPLTVFCSEQEAADVRALGDQALRIETDASAERLSAFDVVIKSPGISAYRPELLAAAASGTRFIGGTALWLAARPDARTVCVTGTKGKSTTSALIAHLLRKGGHRTALAGNIGMPLLELLDGEADAWVVELSSYQTRDVAASGVRPGVAVVTNVYPEHLDWHGSEQRYIDDKLALVTDANPRVAILNAGDPRLVALCGSGHGREMLAEEHRGHGRSHAVSVRWFNDADGWHLRDDALYRGGTFVMDTAPVPLPGRHNRGNLCAALAAIDALGIDAAALAPHALSFKPLPHRLQTLGVRDGITWVNDSISTTPHATLAALDVFRDRPVALLVGGHDRGLDWAVFAEAMQRGCPRGIVTMGQNGARIHGLLEPLAAAGAFTLCRASDLGQAVALARAALDGDGVVLLSPGAPSYGVYRDFTERGRHFAALAGFDPQVITAIPGIGIA